MTRKKKTRKGGPLAAAKKPDGFKPASKSQVGKMPNGKGHKPGSRHSAGKLAQQQHKPSQETGIDPRHGSKTPVQLLDPKTAIEKVSSPAEPHLSAAERSKFESELEALQNDSRLQQLLERLEEDDELSAEESAYVDSCTDRFDVLADKLGLNDEE